MKRTLSVYQRLEICQNALMVAHEEVDHWQGEVDRWQRLALAGEESDSSSSDPMPLVPFVGPNEELIPGLFSYPSEYEISHEAYEAARRHWYTVKYQGIADIVNDQDTPLLLAGQCW